MIRFSQALLPIICLIQIIASETVTAANKKNDLPEIGVVASSAISVDKEMQIGDALMRQLRGQAPIVRDPLLDEYIQDIGNRLVAQAENVKFPYTFFTLNSPDINAFAFFGGHIGIHTGLIFNARTESELASVLAHEVSHVTQRHIARSIAAQQKSSPLQLASLLGGILLAAVNPEVGMAAISVGNAASTQSSINYTRQNEKEADRVGISILAEAGFDPNGASSFFNILAEKNRSKSAPMAFLLTHPLPESRVSDARTRAAMFRPRNIPPSINFSFGQISGVSPLLCRSRT
ncbi:M48 family metalloprotease [Paraglaciecola aquimarina]|uniref:M48 family metalloprotease n=1 Tax=Paraglaciecola aquimarina TaxID=1235557 RepID=A0ABU3SY95_9ALTE|nr:M48 family metalloprotease [Paraglaciecola aquimarina]MDU0354966.1 M48 family metalloprotease [Paraglaciecola aquimarina]